MLCCVVYSRCSYKFTECTQGEAVAARVNATATSTSGGQSREERRGTAWHSEARHGKRIVETLESKVLAYTLLKR